MSLRLERRVGRYAGACAFASLAASLGALLAANAGVARGEHRSADAGSDLERMQRLVDFHASAHAQTLAAGLRSLGVALSIGVAVYLVWLVRRRGGVAGRVVAVSAIAGPLLLLAATVLGFLAFRDVADAYFASGARSAARAGALLDDSRDLHAVQALDWVSRAVFAVWVAALSTQLMRLGLFTSFLGYWGIGAAVALVVLPVGDAMYIGWLASIAFLACGYWPGGRPEAWDSAPSTAAPAS